MDETRNGSERLQGDVNEHAEFVSANELAVSGLASIIPTCKCGAGPCRRGVTDEGRAYLTCCMQKGFGSCGYFKWVDPDMLRLEDLVDLFNSDRHRLQETAKKLRKQVEMIKKKGQRAQASASEAGGSQASGSQASGSQVVGSGACGPQVGGSEAGHSEAGGSQAASLLSGVQTD